MTADDERKDGKMEEQKGKELRIKRLYETQEPDDGLRILVDRLWPRGLAKASAPFDRWARQIAPSPQLRRWFHQNGERFAQFSDSYREELAHNPDMPEFFARVKSQLESSDVTLLFASRDRENNHAAVLADWMREQLEKEKELVQEKQTLRKEWLRRADRLPEDYVTHSSDAIREKVLGSPAYQEADSVFIYLSMWKEPDTRKLIALALEEGKRVYVPRCGPRRQMEAVQISDGAELTEGRLGIPEPGGEGEEEKDRIDLAIIPCVAASASGRRLGHGMAYYDVFLRNSRMTKLCLCHEQLLSPDIPMTLLDVWMDQVITGR